MRDSETGTFFSILIKEYNGAYKPFVSKMSFDVSFSGTI